MMTSWRVFTSVPYEIRAVIWSISEARLAQLVCASELLLVVRVSM